MISRTCVHIRWTLLWLWEEPMTLSTFLVAVLYKYCLRCLQLLLSSASYFSVWWLATVTKETWIRQGSFFRILCCKCYCTTKGISIETYETPLDPPLQTVSCLWTSLNSPLSYYCTCFKLAMLQRACWNGGGYMTTVGDITGMKCDLQSRARVAMRHWCGRPWTSTAA